MAKMGYMENGALKPKVRGCRKLRQDAPFRKMSLYPS